MNVNWIKNSQLPSRWKMKNTCMAEPSSESRLPKSESRKPKAGSRKPEANSKHLQRTRTEEARRSRMGNFEKRCVAMLLYDHDHFMHWWKAKGEKLQKMCVELEGMGWDEHVNMTPCLKLTLHFFEWCLEWLWTFVGSKRSTCRPNMCFKCLLFENDPKSAVFGYDTPALLKGRRVCHFPSLSLKDLAVNDKKMTKHNKANFMDVNWTGSSIDQM